MQLHATSRSARPRRARSTRSAARRAPAVRNEHAEQVALQLSREARPYPQLIIGRRPPSIFDYEYEDFAVEGYDPHPAIKAPVAV